MNIIKNNNINEYFINKITNNNKKSASKIYTEIELKLQYSNLHP